MATDFLFKVLQPPTGVTDCASGYITEPRFFAGNPNLILVSSNVLEVFTLRVSYDDKLMSNYSALDGVSGALLELTCSMSLYDIVESVRVLSSESAAIRDKIVVVYERARISVYEYDGSIDKLVICNFIDNRTSILLIKPPMLHCNMDIYSARRQIARVDSKGKYAAIVIYGVSITLLKVSQEGVDVTRNNIKHRTHQIFAAANILDFTFIDDGEKLAGGNSEAILYTLHESDPPHVGRIVCAYGVSTTLDLELLPMPLINVPDDAYKLLAMRAPYGGFILFCSKNVTYYKSGAQPCQIDSNNLGMIDFCTLLKPDLVLLSRKSGGVSYMRLVHDVGACTVQRLEVFHRTTDSFLTSATTLGENFFFLGSRLERKLKQLHWRIGENMIEVEDRDRDSLMTIGPLKDFFFLKEKKADGVPSSYGLVCCSGHGKKGVLYKFHFSVRPTVLKTMHTTTTEECTGLWIVHSKESLAEHSQTHTYMISSYESYTEIVRVDDGFENSTRQVFPGSTIIAGDLFGRRGCILVQSNHCLIYNWETRPHQKLEFPNTDTISKATVLENFVLLLMNDGRIRLLFFADPFTHTIQECRLEKVQDPNNLITACTLYSDSATTPWIQSFDPTPHRVYLVVFYRSGNLRMFDLPHLRCIFSVDRFSSGRSCIGDDCEDCYQNDGRYGNQNLNMVELAMYRWPGEKSRPYLFAIFCDGTILCYHGFYYGSHLRFSRVNLDYTRGRMSEKNEHQRITTFERAGNCQGFFLSGPRPMWFMKSRDRFQIHPQLSDGSIYGFAAVNTSCCEHGFIYASKGAVKLCQLPPLSYDHHWPVQEVSLPAIPCKIEYLELNFYSLIVSTAGGKDEVWICNLENNHASLISTGDEKPCVMRKVTLDVDMKTPKTFIAIGTADKKYGGGSVSLYSFEVQARKLYSRKMKGPVSALVSFQRCLLVASGAELTLLMLKGSLLLPVARYEDTPLYVVDMHALADNQHLLITDVHKGVYLARRTEAASSQLEVLDQSLGDKNCLSSIILGLDDASIMVSNNKKKVQVAKLNKGYSLTGGEDWFYVGTHVTKFLAVKMPELDGGPLKLQRMSSFFCTEDGSIGCFAPLPRRLSNILRSLQITLLEEIPHIHGSDPKRNFDEDEDNSYHWRPQIAKMIDYEVLSHYPMLTFERQAELAEELETTPPKIISVWDDIVLDTHIL